MKNCFFILGLLLFLGACSEEPELSGVRLKKVSFADLNGFDSDNVSEVYDSFMKSCTVVSRQTGEFLGNSEIKINRRDYLAACDKAAKIAPADFRRFIQENFTPYQVIYKGSPEGKFTAYYEAEIHASYTKDDVYKYPVYGRPYDMIEINLKDFDASLPAQKIVGRLKGNKLVPYYSRAEITADGANAPVILWGDSYIDIYIMQIQGSAVAVLPDNTKTRIAFAESNGRPFKGIGAILLGKGLLKSGQASMGSIKKWLKDNPDLAVENMDENQRYIFHRLGNPEGPVGALGIPLTSGRALAVDRSYMPLGALIWLETAAPSGNPLNRIVLAADIGSAIKGAVRGDYFWGSGGDDVLETAGKMNSSGQYFVLIPNKAEEK